MNQFLDEEDEELEKLGMGKLEVPWYTKIIMRFCPKLFMRWQAKRMGIDPIFDGAHELFSGVKRVDLFPHGGRSGRSLIMILDRKTALFFYQDGDHFIYDGFEMGEYEKGDTAIFDQLKDIKSPYK